MEKYSRVYYSNDYLYLEQSPVVILAYAILKNNFTNEIIGQIKLKSISDKKIKTVEVELELYDSAGKMQKEKVSHEFLDLNVLKNTEFGSKEAIELPYNNSRSFKVNVKKVVFYDGETWNNKKSYYKLEKQQRLDSILNSVELSYFRKKYGDTFSYIPIKEKNIWMCSCGNINTIEEEKCSNCNIDKNTIFNIKYDDIKKEALYYMSLSYLETSEINLIEIAENNFKNLGKYKDSKEKSIECIEKIKELKLKQKRKKIIVDGILFIIVAVLALFAFINYINNSLSINYKMAKKYMKQGRYSAACERLEKLTGDYKDSSKLKLDCCIPYAEQLLDEGKYEEAVNIYNSLNDTTDERQLENKINLKNKIKYAYVIDHNDNTDFTTYNYLANLIEYNYKDSLEIYNKLYNIDCKIIINDKKNDFLLAPTKINSDSGIHDHYNITENTMDQLRIKIVHEYKKDNKWYLAEEWRPGIWSTNRWDSFDYHHFNYHNNTYNRLVIYNFDTNEKICSSNEVLLY